MALVVCGGLQPDSVENLAQAPADLNSTRAVSLITECWPSVRTTVFDRLISTTVGQMVEDLGRVSQGHSHGSSESCVDSAMACWEK